jgi:catechol 2,3-dioxygenase-like lactoylglutathione lyase family enzyme
MLLKDINHIAIALISKDIDALRAFYTDVFDAEVGPTKPHGDQGDETMTTIRIGPHTELNVFTIEGNPEPDRQKPMGTRPARPHRPASRVRRQLRDDPTASRRAWCQRRRGQRLRLSAQPLLPRPRRAGGRGARREIV